MEAANNVGALIEQLQERRTSLAKIVECVEAMGTDHEAQARLLAKDGVPQMAGVREICDTLELVVGDEYWPLPKYSEILFIK